MGVFSLFAPFFPWVYRMSPVSLQGGVAVGGRRVPWEASMLVFSLFAHFFSNGIPKIASRGKSRRGDWERYHVNPTPIPYTTVLL